MSTNDHKMVSCNETDREILLIFKKGIIDLDGRISSWTTKKDCCSWEGIHCDNITRRVTRVELPVDSILVEEPKFLYGEMNLCILKLEFLNHLDLSWNAFHKISIPSIQHNITHASKLFFLDLSINLGGSLYMDNLDWLSPLSSLKYLNLTGIHLHKKINWLQPMATLSSLIELKLRRCNLENISVEYLNFTSLVTLDLSDNNFTSHLPNGFFNLTKDITYLNFGRSNINGDIPSSLLNLRNLRVLILSQNQLQGPVPNEIGQLAHIEYLDLSKNMLSGFIPPTLGNLSSLLYLSIGSNNFSGEISKKTFSKLSSLTDLDLSNSNFVFQFDFDWVPPFQLYSLFMPLTNQGPNFPSWIYTQKSLISLDLSSSGISLVDKNKFFNIIEGTTNLLLSNNSITEDISSVRLKCYNVQLDHNNFTGGLPNLSLIARTVDLSYNSFSGSIPHTWKNLEGLEYINLWSNKLCGEVLVHLSNWKNLILLNLGGNEFSGIIPVTVSQNLEIVILRGNQFEGTIPKNLFNLQYLFHLDLAHNNFSGSLPDCVYNLSDMVAPQTMVWWYSTSIELYTKGQDYVYQPTLGRRTIDLSVNSLTGEMPLELFLLVQVQTLNLSHNNFIGTIPETIGGMTNMESLDLSNNKLYGEIPQSMTLLTFLEYLNLSHNNFKGKIPTGTQLQSFSSSSYIGNPNLCGAPLKNCTTEEENPNTATPSRENEDDDSIKESLYLGMGVGFAVGFWGICGSLFLIRKWRHMYFRFVDGAKDKLYVTLMVKLNRFSRNRFPAS